MSALFVVSLFKEVSVLVAPNLKTFAFYSSSVQCDPYFDQTGCAHPRCEPAYPTPKCEKKCQVKNPLWTDTKHFSVNAYRINSYPHDIMAEV